MLHRACIVAQGGRTPRTAWGANGRPDRGHRSGLAPPVLIRGVVASCPHEILHRSLPRTETAPFASTAAAAAAAASAAATATATAAAAAAAADASAAASASAATCAAFAASLFFGSLNLAAWQSKKGTEALKLREGIGVKRFCVNYNPVKPWRRLRLTRCVVNVSCTRDRWRPSHTEAAFAARRGPEKLVPEAQKVSHAKNEVQDHLHPEHAA